MGGRLNQRLVRPVIDRYLDAEVVEGRSRCVQRWTEVLDQMQVSTPNEHVDRMVEHLERLPVHGRSTSAVGLYFESGIGRHGLPGLLPGPARLRADGPDRARAHPRHRGDPARSGGAYHQYAPLTKRGNDAIGSGFNDDPLWLVLAVAAYVKETGDRSILDELVAYDSRPGSERPLLEHLHRSVEYTLDRLGPLRTDRHQDDRHERADNNLQDDLRDEEPRVDHEIEAAERLVRLGVHRRPVRVKAELAAITHEDRWPGAAAAMADVVLSMVTRVVRAAYDHFGSPVGSATCEDGQIFIEPQGMRDGGDRSGGRARRRALDLSPISSPPSTASSCCASHQRHLPDRRDHVVPAGYKENGSVSATRICG
jgi:cellobiose phosphorylase